MSKKICLIDADSTIPNVALMKLSSYHKKQGDDVILLKADIPYYPNRIKKEFIVPDKYDKVYCSVLFNDNQKWIKGKDIIFGGTGSSLSATLPEEIERGEPDYSIYGENNISYGFISRGCIRKCEFCVVPKKEGKIKQVSEIEAIVRHKKVKFLDNNFLALPNHKILLKELIDKKIKCQFFQGLDIKLIDEENSELLSELNYMGEYIFAFDNYKDFSIIEKKLKLLSWRKEWQLKFYMFCHPDMELSNVCKRVAWARDKKVLPYVMRHISCWETPLSNFYVDLAAYGNQPSIFKKMKFDEYLSKRDIKSSRAENSRRLYYSSL